MELNRKKLGVQEVNQHESYGYSFYNKKKDKENIYGDQGKYMGKNLQGWKKKLLSIARRKWVFAPFYQTIQHFTPFPKLIREMSLF